MPAGGSAGGIEIAPGESLAQAIADERRSAKALQRHGRVGAGGGRQRLPPRPTEPPKGQPPRVRAQTRLRSRLCPQPSSLRASMPSALSAPLSLSPSFPALTVEAGSRSPGDPSLAASSVAPIASFQLEGEAGIGERLRSDEVLRETTKLLPAPPTDHPEVRHQAVCPFLIHCGFGVACAPSPRLR